MKAMRLENDWGLDNIHLVDVADPEPGDDDVVIAMRAVSINPRDLVMMRGGYGRMGGKPPLIPLCDGAGEIVAVGADVDDLAVGDFVCPAYSRTWPDGQVGPTSHLGAHGGPIDGTMCELMSVPATSVVRAPPHMSPTEAATLPCAALTAWNALVEQGRIGAGARVLLLGTGAVSLFALQIAKLKGAEVIITSSSDEKLRRAAMLGADHVINYRRQPDWHKIVREISAGVGVDHIIEVGGGETLEKSISAVRPSGVISLIGVLSGAVSTLQLGRVVTRNVRLQGVTVGSTALFRQMIDAFASARLRPVIDDRPFVFDDLPGALARLPEGRHFGKIVCRF